VRELPELRDRTFVFRDRREAGEVLRRMLEGQLPAGAKILAIPAGGVPVAVPLAEALKLPLALAVVSKVAPSWNSEVGYGAVAFDGRVRLDAKSMARLGVDEREARTGVERTLAKVRQRVRSLSEGSQAVVGPGDTAVLVDDGLASGFTMTIAIEAVREAGAGRVIVAVPTGSESAVNRVASSADEVYCANVRTGWSFAVADAYENWSDVDDATLLDMLKQLRLSRARSING